MTATGELPPEIAFRVGAAIKEIEAILVGGQAVNFWAERYSSSVPELAEFGPYASKDVDFFGHSAAARQLASRLGGHVFFPSPDHLNTPNSAVVSAIIDGHEVRVDFLKSLLGIGETPDAVRMVLSAEVGGLLVDFSLYVLHPVECLISRITNIFHPATMRQDDFAIRQTHAAHWVVRKYISDAVEELNHHEVNICIRKLYFFLYNGYYGPHCHVSLPLDQLDILRSIRDHPGLHPRYRQFTLGPMISRIEKRRAAAAFRHAPSDATRTAKRPASRTGPACRQL